MRVELIFNKINIDSILRKMQKVFRRDTSRLIFPYLQCVIALLLFHHVVFNLAMFIFIF